MVLACCAGFVFAQSKSKPSDKFRQLEEDLPTPNEYRTASGAPGHRYWQQRADYVIDVELDDVNQRIIGKETVTYKNLSPDTLNYIWLQIDQNIFAKDSLAQKTSTAPEFRNMPLSRVEQLAAREYEGRVNITSVRDARGNPLKNTLNETMLRIDLPTPLAPGGTFVFSVDWNYNINNGALFGGRTSYEYFPEDNNYLYTIAQWFPRLAAYNDTTGWQHKQYLGSGEFTLEFGDYLVRITVPDDHVVSATGVLQNPNQVLKPAWRERLRQAETAREPIYIVTKDEAAANEKGRPAGKKTWIYKADEVRDFAFASSRKFIWDAQGHNVGGNKVMAQSLYPKEASPLWDKFSTHAIIHTLNVYSRYSFDYPYPSAISVSNRHVGGMEYPMICFNGPRPNPDGTYSSQAKYGLISVVIHEVGHNYFPMIVNSDERQWTWMDEGLNTFLQYLSEQEWERNYPSWRGEPKLITEYMMSENQVPIMTNSESVLQFGNNAYGKPATALNILRETVMGRDLFDFAFKEYSRRWKFKRPQPADFFRTMEDASGVDLDWFWRGWFYSTDHVDISIENVRLFQMDTKNPEVEKELQRKQANAEPRTLSQQRNQGLPLRVDQYPSLRDMYNDTENNRFRVTEQDRQSYQAFYSTLTDKEKALLNGNYHFYVVDLKNVGGLVMPLIFKVEYMDGTSEEIRVPVEIWRYNNWEVSKLIVTRKEAKAIILDPNLETADADLNNNFFPRRTVPTRFQIFKQGQPNRAQTNTPGAANVAGRWNIAVDAGGQTLSAVLNLTQQGNTISGTIESPQGTIQITSGTMENGRFTLKTTTPIELTFTGQASGNQISGSVVSPQGTAPFSGSKAN
ncbi:MAG: M1 family metallopeptidase [Acidobacteriota bacterium]|nr:M1 family metallopeptidase [Acidobacteriota bacterium]